MKIDVFTDPKYKHLYGDDFPRPQPSDFAVSYFNEQENLIFVDIGANDGITCSNSLPFEINYNWKGLCIEPHPAAFSKLIANRNCTCLNYAVSENEMELDFLVIEGKAEMLSGLVKDYHPDHIQRIKRETEANGDKVYTQKVISKSLPQLLKENNITKVSYLSIDTEGSELPIIKGIDFSAVDIDLVSIEVNYDISPFNEIMERNGYVFIKKVCTDAFYRKK